MKTFAYYRAEQPQQASHLLASHSGKFIAGGTNLLDLMKLQLETPIALVDISRLPLTDIEKTPDGGLKIGAMVTNSDLAADAQIRKYYPVLSKALLAGASGQLRNKASTGGNLLQRTRCYYFYAPDSACNKRKPGSGCPALAGKNRMLAILGISEHCIAQHPSDMAVALRALGASVQTQLADGASRQIDLADFYLKPEDHPERETVLAHGELITHVILPPPVAGQQTYKKIRDRASYAFALTSLAMIAEVKAGSSIDEQRFNHVQLAFGGIGVMPWRNPAVEQLLTSQPANHALFHAAADLLLQDAKGSGENDFKISLTRRLLVSALSDALKGALS